MIVLIVLLLIIAVIAIYQMGRLQVLLTRVEPDNELNNERRFYLAILTFIALLFFGRLSYDHAYTTGVFDLHTRVVVVDMLSNGEAVITPLAP